MANSGEPLVNDTLLISDSPSDLPWGLWTLQLGVLAGGRSCREKKEHVGGAAGPGLLPALAPALGPCGEGWGSLAVRRNSSGVWWGN